MKLSYGSLEFKLLRITDYENVTVWTEDGANYLYNSISIRCECILNPQATSYRFGTALAGTSIAPGISSPVKSYAAIAFELKKPRQLLLVTADSSIDDNGNAVGNTEELLRSPARAPDGTSFTVDARIGPVCTVHRIDTSHGYSSLWMDLEFKTDLVACAPPTDTNLKGIMNPVLVNSFTSEVEHDPSHHTAIHITRGTAHFRRDLLEKQKITPDQLRKYFIHPIPPGFRRDPPTLMLHPDGCAITYEIVDREQLLSFIGGARYNATEISVIESRHYHQPSISF